MQSAESRFGKTPFVFGLVLSLVYVTIVFFTFDQKLLFSTSFELIAGVIFIFFFSFPLIRDVLKYFFNQSDNQVQEKTHECRFQPFFNLEHIPTMGSGHTMFMVIFCHDCGTAKFFPSSNYLLLSQECREDLKKVLIEKGAKRIIEPQLNE